jgi:predicted nucleic acid-binding protein
MVNIYLDVCCLSRPFDDHSHDRVRIESEAVLTIMQRSRQERRWRLVGSEAVAVEISKIPDDDKKQKVSILSSMLQPVIAVTDAVEKRACALESFGFKPYDALHIACAEHAKADVLLTTDDHLLRTAIKTRALKVRLENPVVWLMEAINK